MRGWLACLRRTGGVLLLLVALPATGRAQQPDSARPQPAGAMGIVPDDYLRALRFRPIGPANTSGRVTAIAVPKGNDGRTAYVGFAGAGVWKTSNMGTTWSPIFDDHMSSIGDIAIAESDTSIVWVGTGERQSLRSNAWGDGVYKSTDGGRTWRHMGLRETKSIGRIAIHPKNPDIVYVAAMGDIWGTSRERGVYKTTDGGGTWQQVLFVNDTVGIVDLKLDPSNPDVLLAAGWHRLRRGGPAMEGAGSGSGIWKSTDGGRSWRDLTAPDANNGLPARGRMGRIGVAYAPSSPKRVYAIIQLAEGAWNPTVSTHGGLFRSEDGGNRWQRVHDVSALPDYFYNEVYVDPQNPDNVYLNSVQLQRSTDGGETFSEWRMENVHVDHHAFWINPRDSQVMLDGNDGGLYTTFDGGETWLHHKIPATQFYEVMIDSTKAPWEVCGGMQDNGTWCAPNRTRDRSGVTERDWYAIYGGDGFHSAVAPDSPNFRYAESQYAGISRWDTRDMQRIAIQPHAEDAGAEAGFPFRWDWNTPFVLSQHDPTVLYLGGNYLFRLPDRGRRGWQIISPDLTRGNRASPAPDTGYTAYRALHSIAESPLDARVIWTGSDDGLVHVTFDGGQSWRNVTDNIPSAEARQCWVAEIEASRFDVGTAYVAFDCHRRGGYRPWLFRTTDRGATFTDITGALTDPADSVAMKRGTGLPADGVSYVIREDPVNRWLIYVGTERGLWFSNQGGFAWQRLRGNLPTAAIRDMDIFPGERTLVVSTFGRGIWLLPLNVLQELTDSTLARPAHVFAVDDARVYNMVSEHESYGSKFFRVPNPPQGVSIAYHLRADQGRDVQLTIRRVAEEGEREGGPAGADSAAVQTLTGSGRAGVHTVTWDLLAQEPRPRRLGDPVNPAELRRVAAGTYQVSLRVGGETYTRRFRVSDGWYDRQD